jgi:hypothetical protein
MMICLKISRPSHSEPQSYQQRYFLLEKQLFEYDFWVAKVSSKHFEFFEGLQGSRVFSLT